MAVKERQAAHGREGKDTGFLASSQMDKQLKKLSFLPLQKEKEE